MAISLNEQLILGILTEGPQHGYHIEQVITERGMRQWSDIGFSSIYYILDKLEKKGLTDSKSSKGKEKKEYQITDKGVEALKEATLEMICERKPTNTHFMTGFATSFLLDNEELIVALSKRKENLETDLSNMLHERENSQHHAPIAQQLFSLGQTLTLAELDWINQEIHLLQGGNEDGI